MLERNIPSTLLQRVSYKELGEISKMTLIFHIREIYFYTLTSSKMKVTTWRGDELSSNGGI